MVVTSGGTGFDLPALWDVMNACSGRVERHTLHVSTRQRCDVCWHSGSINNGAEQKSSVPRGLHAQCVTARTSCCATAGEATRHMVRPSVCQTIDTNIDR